MSLKRQIKRWFRKRESILVEVLTLLIAVVVVVVAFFACLLFGVPWLTLLETVLPLLVVIFGFYLFWIRQRNKTMMISFTSKYLLEEEPKIDELLGILIAGRWEKLKIDPIEEFFGCLKRICEKKDNYEMRRRVAEALPALFKFDLEESKELVETLRQDWDQRWKADNRRRTIEELSYIVKKEKDFVKKNIQIIEGDEIFTIFAIVEILDELRKKVKKEEAERIFSDLKNEMETKNFGEDEINAVSELWALLDLINSDPDQALKKFDDLKESPNVYIQICGARNLKHFFKRSPERILKLMNYFLGEDKDKNVRRPIAKEDSVDCLINILRDKRLSDKAMATIWKLIQDTDDTIRFATFDKIEKIMDVDNDLGKKIIKYVAQNDPDKKLVIRAENLLKKVI